MNAAAGLQLTEFVRAGSARLVELTRDLVRIPSENRAPDGSESQCQQFIASRLRACGWNPTLYSPASVPGISEHPLWWPGRNYSGRPNVGARLPGAGGGRSLVLSGHIDTVPAGSEPWQHNPFGGEVEGNRLYGRGSVDMKGGIATSLFVVEALRDLKIRLKGDLIFESVVDEEFGGVNGTLAGRLAGFNGDAAVLCEPTALRICPAQRGGRTAHITFRAPNDGILGAAGGSAVEQLRLFLEWLGRFREGRAKASVHPLYAHLSDAVPVTVTRIHTAPWGTGEPTNIPSTCRVELFWQAMPDETADTIDREFHAWFEAMLAAHPGAFRLRPDIEHPIRWLPGSALGAGNNLVCELSECAGEVLAATPPVEGIEGPCDMFVFHEFGIPALLWGARGGNLHNPDEYVEIDSLVDAASVLLAFVCRWCGVVDPS